MKKIKHKNILLRNETIIAPKPCDMWQIANITDIDIAKNVLFGDFSKNLIKYALKKSSSLYPVIIDTKK
ncbi:MAG: hypothetical protein FWE72_01300 [Spirochaetaceae bacterium]|nr:hypothetical protein [Spirochaetaceae bacterium]